MYLEGAHFGMLKTGDFGVKTGDLGAKTGMLEKNVIKTGPVGVKSGSPRGMVGGGSGRRGDGGRD